MSAASAIKFQAEICEALDAISGSGVPAPEVTFVHDDVHGSTALVVRDIKEELRRFSGVTYDLAYAHAEPGQELPEPQSLKRLMPRRFSLGVEDRRSPQFMGVEDGKQSSIVHLHPSILVARASLIDVGHEIGHTVQESLLDGLALAAAGLRHVLTPEQEARAALFKPAVDALLAYGENTPSFRRDIEVLLDISPFDAEARGVCRVRMPGTETPLFREWHPEADFALSAVAEAHASHYGLALAAAGLVHPGLSAEEQQERLIAYAQTYDVKGGGNLHETTLQYAIAQAQYPAADELIIS